MLTFDELTAYQKVALRHVCFLAEETEHPRFFHKLGLGTLIISVNSGYE